MATPTYNQTDAMAFLRALTDAGNDPVLTQADLDRLLPLGQVADASGVAPGGAGYIPTYTYRSLFRPTRAGWLEKAAKAANRFDVGGGSGVSFERSQVWQNCIAMAARYEAVGPGIGTIRVVGAGAV